MQFLSAFRHNYIWAFSILMWGASFWCYTHKTPNLVIFDKALILKPFISQLSQQSLSEQRVQELSEKFAKIMKATIDEYAKSHHVIVIGKEQVLAGESEEVTQIIASRIASKMRGAS